MPHVAITMIPGRDDVTKKELAEKMQLFLAKELAVDKKFVSVSIQDVPIRDWDSEMKKFPDDSMFVPSVPIS